VNRETLVEPLVHFTLEHDPGKRLPLRPDRREQNSIDITMILETIG
jgi:hypothetical protein